MIFVFGSNLAGRHGAGAAKYAAQHHGAEYGVGHGVTGNCYAIPTKDRNLSVLPLETVKIYVNEFLGHAWNNSHTEFQVTQIGCGLAGFKPEQIAPLFAGATDNCLFDSAWKEWLPNVRFWGTK
jgi:hypothetical protein